MIAEARDMKSRQLRSEIRSPGKALEPISTSAGMSSCVALRSRMADMASALRPNGRNACYGKVAMVCAFRLSTTTGAGTLVPKGVGVPYFALGFVIAFA